MSSVLKQIADFTKHVEKVQADAERNAYQFVTKSVIQVEGTAKKLMRDTVVDPSIVYGKRGHHPSVEGHPPAPDTGTLLQSVTHSVEVEGDKVVGYVGSTLKNPDYPKYLEFGTRDLEFGTSRMKPRPWLMPAVNKCASFMKELAEKLIWGSMK